MGQIQFTIALIMIGLFTIAVLGFAINFASDNEVYVDISDDEQISNLYTGSTSNVSEFTSASEDTYKSIINSTISSGDETTVGGGQFKITPASSVGVTRNILRVGYSRIFGHDSGFAIFLIAFLSIITFIIALLICKTWAGKMPD